jgi:hypothetical protein
VIRETTLTFFVRRYTVNTKKSKKIYYIFKCKFFHGFNILHMKYETQFNVYASLSYWNYKQLVNVMKYINNCSCYLSKCDILFNTWSLCTRYIRKEMFSKHKSVRRAHTRERVTLIYIYTQTNTNYRLILTQNQTK